MDILTLGTGSEEFQCVGRFSFVRIGGTSESLVLLGRLLDEVYFVRLSSYPYLRYVTTK